MAECLQKTLPRSQFTFAPKRIS